MEKIDINALVRLAGLAQISIAVGSVAIPKILKWVDELAKVDKLIKQIFWTYACYILTFNLSFGLLSVFAYRDITNGSTLATLVSGFIAVYWISRVLVQFFYFDRANFPKGIWPKIGEAVLVSLFICLSAAYSYACYYNLKPF